MRSILIAAITTLSLSAFAEPQTFTVTGMHCGGCAKAIEDTVCKIEGLKACSAKLTNAKKQQGQIVVERADGQPVDQDVITKALQAAGDYQLTSNKTNKKK